MIELTRDDVLDLLFGATYLGTGGGGELDEGIALIDEAARAGKRFYLEQLEDASQDMLACTPYFLGAISALPAEEELLYERLPKPEGQAIQRAYERLEEYLGQTIYGSVACELGGTNTAVAFYVAAMNDGVVLDGDPAGRAVPEITHSTYYLNQLPASPIIVANAFGEMMMLENIIDDQRAEHVVRSLAMVSRNDVAAIDHALPISELKDALIHGTMSLSLKIGKACREAIANGADTAKLLAEIGGGTVAFRGEVFETSWRTQDGFTFGDFALAGQGEYQGQRYDITLKNENMAAWRDGALDIVIPDLICAIDTNTGAPVTNPNTHIGQHIAIVHLPAPKEFQTPQGREIFGPTYIGLEDG